MPDVFDLPARPYTKEIIARWYIDGRLRADTGAAQGAVVALPNWSTPAELIEGESVFAALAATTAGAALTIDIKWSATYEGTRASIFTSTVPSIAIGDVHTGDTSSVDGTIAPNYLRVDGGFYWLYVTQVGSTSGSEGTDLSVQIIAKVFAETP